VNDARGVVLCQPGEALCAGELTYPGLRAAAEQRGVRLVPVRQDGEGLDPDALDEACRSARPSTLYLVPTLDNPTTATMSRPRREAIVAVARRHDLAVIEDDAYGALPADSPAPLAALAPERTWHVASLSKCATPALRIAYVATPGLAHTLRLGGAIRALSLMAPPLQAAIATRFAEDGTLDALAAAIRRENQARQRLAREILRGADLAAHADGHHLWLRLPAPWRRGEFVARARESGLSIVPSDAFALTAVPPEAVRLSLGIARDIDLLGRALGALAAILARSPGLAAIV
jgi:DNA-binding transcriptional MocR family regulator